MKILYTSADVRKAIVLLFSKTAGRRVVISAFVGEGAGAFLPSPEGLELYCWPKAGGTNPTILRRLINRGAKVYFASSLHMKVYWTEKGAIIASANLSNNALGSGNLKEIGVLLPPGHVNIKRILDSINYRLASEETLATLDRETLLLSTGQMPPSLYSENKSFKQWYGAPFRPKWKLGWWDDQGAVAKSVKERSIKEYDVREPYDVLSCDEDAYEPGDWALEFGLDDNGARSIRWMYVDFVEKIKRADKGAYERDWPYQAAQVFPLSRYPHPPFRVDDNFRKAFTRAVKQFGAENIKSLKTNHPPKRLISLVHDNY